MADCVRPIAEWVFTTLRDRLLEEARALVTLGATVDDLLREMEALRDAHGDILRGVVIKETHRMARTHRVSRWLTSVESLSREVDELEASFVRGAGAGGRSWWEGYQLRRRAAGLLKRIREVKSQGNFDVLVSQAPPTTAEEVPISTASMVGREEAMAAIRGHLEDNGARVIGVYGMGGIGKTTLLKEINNELAHAGTDVFDVVIWTTVSRDLDAFKVQKEIGDRLGLSFDKEQPERTRTALFHALRRKRFLLLLDDLWAKLSLEELGIPLPTSLNQSKILLTTRSREVCIAMDANAVVKVKVLDETASWKLFLSKMGEDAAVTQHPSILPLAKAVAAKCGGLPLALITVGRAMAGASTAHEWEDAMNAFSRSPGDLPGMEEEVLAQLKFSFDRLRDQTLKQCLLYCCLFPEDHRIKVEALITLWVGEGLLDDGGGSIDAARNRGHVAISRLQLACLLETPDPSGWPCEKTVRMHDAVREMALWLTNGRVEGAELFVVEAGRERPVARTVDRWRDATRVSLGSNRNRDQLEKLVEGIPVCLRLRTLLLRDCIVPDSMTPKISIQLPALRVLDLWAAYVEQLPEEIGSLVELQYLGMSGANIKSVPLGLGNLVKLRHLDLSYTASLEWIPRVAVMKLTRLQVLNLFASRYRLHSILDDMETQEAEEEKRWMKRLDDAAESSKIWGEEELEEEEYIEEEEAEEEDQNEYMDEEDDELEEEEEVLEGQEHQEEASSPLFSPFPSSRKSRLTLVDVEELLGHGRLEELGLDLEASFSVTALLKQTRALRCTRLLSLWHIWEAEPLEQLENLRHLELYGSTIDIEQVRRHCGRLRSLEHLSIDQLREPSTTGEHSSVCTSVGREDELLLPRLRLLSITLCHGFQNLTWVGRLVCLEQLEVVGCEGIEELLLPPSGGVGGGEEKEEEQDLLYDSSSLTRLKVVRLECLPALRSISRRVLLLPALEMIFVDRCPQLRKLPLGDRSAQKLRFIHGSQQWWEGLEWDANLDLGNQSTSRIKSVFSPFTIPDYPAD